MAGEIVRRETFRISIHEISKIGVTNSGAGKLGPFLNKWQNFYWKRVHEIIFKTDQKFWSTTFH